MALLSVPFSFSAGAVIIAAQHNSNFSTIYADYSGNIQDVNIASNAAIAYSKLVLTNSIVNADIAAGTIIDASKIAAIPESGVTFNTTTGHAHTGVDSKKVLATNIDPTGLSTGTGYFVYNNSGTLATTAIPKLANIIGGTITTSTAAYAPLFGGATATTESSARTYFSFAGTLKNFYAYTANATNNTLVLYKNGSATAITVSSILAGAYSDLTHTVSVAAGDYLYIYAASVNGTWTFTMEFDPS